MKKILFIIILIMIVSVNACATEQINTDILDDSLEGVQRYPSYSSIEDVINLILNNELQLDGATVLENIIQMIFISLKSALPMLSALLSVVIVTSVVEKLKLLSGKVENICLIGGRIIFSVMLLGFVFDYVDSVKDTFVGIKSFTQALTPILITLLASCGAKGSVSTLAPSSVLLSSILIELTVKFILPLIIAGCIVTLVDNVLNDGKLAGIAATVKSVSSWGIGGIFTVFSAIIAIQGIVAGINDGVSIRSIKYALSTSVPVIGGSISESFSAVLMSGFYLKSALGVAGIITILSIVLLPIINIIAVHILLSLFSGIIRPFADSVIVAQINGINEFLKLLIAILIGVGVLWTVYLGVIACAGGSFM